MHIFLETDRLVLRAFTEADADHLFALDNGHDVMRFINGGRPTSREVIHKGFTDLGVERVTANTMSVNTGSRRVMEKAGLSFLRHFTGNWPEAIEGSEHGEVEYELTRSTWEQHP